MASFFGSLIAAIWELKEVFPVRYYNDVWEFDVDELKWTLLEIKGSCPEPRGGCQLALHGDVLFVFGGHSMVWEKAGETDEVFDDIWALHLESLQV